MNTEQLLNLARVYREHREFITNEETAKMALVVPFIRLLGFEPDNPREVRLEFCAEFTQGDGKRYPDRMDFAIFDSTGRKPLMVVETKPLKTDLKSKAQQLARYIAQIPELRFGIITDGCTYHFYGDLTSPNVMDSEPFFSFSLADDKTDWPAVAGFLNKFSRDTFNAETLVTDAENSRYRQAIVEKLVRVLKAPDQHDEFLRWLTADIYTGKKTTGVMQRLSKLVTEAIEPALLRVMGDDFVERLRERIRAASDKESDRPQESQPGPAGASDSEQPADVARKGVATTEEEEAFLVAVRDICVAAHAAEPEEILAKDTTNYYNISYRRPTKWFLRLFVDSKRKNIATPLPTDVLRQLAPQFEVEDSPPVFGTSRVYVKDGKDVLQMRDVVLRSLETLRA